MSSTDHALSPARHAPGILGCAAVLFAAGAGLGAAAGLSSGAPDARLLDRLAAPAAVARPAAVVAAPPAAAPRDGAVVVAGALTGSLYDSAVAAGAPQAVVSEAVRLFSRKLDFARDLQPGDRFRLVFDRAGDGEGRAVTADALLYAEVGVGDRLTRAYRFAHGGRVDPVDGDGRSSRPLLLRTPVDGARVTSGFGVRLHPILGFDRLHPGVDFGAAEGAPVLAAGDGVVEEAKWAGGYGRWLRIGHADGYETGYGHLLRYAPGVAPGVRVEQGQVVAFVGSSGLSTGPHLHFEIMQDGRKLDPSTAPVPQERELDRAAAAAFDVQKARVDALLAGPAALRLARSSPDAGRGVRTAARRTS